MAKQIFKISKEINVSNNEIIEFLQSKGLSVKSHMNSIEDDEIEMVKKHFGKSSGDNTEKPKAKPEIKEQTENARPVKTEETVKAQPRHTQPVNQQSVNQQPQQMRRPDDRQMRPGMNQGNAGNNNHEMLRRPVPGDRRSQINNGPAPQQRRMLDGPQDRKNFNSNNGQPLRRPDGQQRRMLDGPQQNRRPQPNQQRNGVRVVNGVTISSDDGSRLMHGHLETEAELEALRRQKLKENEKRREAEALKAAEDRKVLEEEARKKAEAAALAKAEEEKAKEAEIKAEEKVSAVKAEEKPVEAAPEKKAENTEPAVDPNKRFKTIGAPVRPNIISRGPVSSQSQRPAFQNDNRNNDRRNGRPDGRPGFNQNRQQSDRNHYQEVGSRYDGNNRGHSNLFENQNQRNGGFSQGNKNNNSFRPNSGFSQRPQGMPGKDEDESRPVSHSRDPRKKGMSAAPEMDSSMKNQNNRRADKSKDKAKADKRFGDFDEMNGGKKGKNQKDPNRAGAFHRPEPVKQEVQEETIKVITLPDVLTIQELADKMKIKGSDIVKKLFMAGKMVSLNSDVTFEEAENIALEYEIICEHEEKVDMVAELLKEADEDTDKLVKRPPVVCVMGHVDHGKTSLLDAIRATNVTSREAGGITQHIGAYMVEANGEKITFLDTPGHEAFTAMRMRGANSTDIAVLVVAADDGVMPQTVEAINHAKAAGVEIIVAVNKIDKPGANIERVKQELTEYELVAEDWGGSTVFVPVSAKTHEGIDKLLEMILLTADVLELKANPNRKARGLVVEAQLDKGRGPVATVLVQKGTLRVGDNIVIGSSMGKVRALINDQGEKVKQATPSMPVAVLGLNSVPDAGEIAVSTSSEKEAKAIAEAYITQNKEKLIAETKSKLSLDDLYSEIKAGNLKELNIIVKADVQGSVEAVKQSLLKLSNDEVAVRIIHGGVGAINESDATLASASNAIIIGFNVKPDNTAKDICEREKVDLRLYSVIYNAIDDVEAALKGMLEPIYEEQVIAHAEVRQTFKASGVGTIAGSFVLDGKVVRGCKARITRGNDQLFDGPLASLKRFKDDVKEVNAGYECGLVFEKYNDLMEGDQIEFYQMVEVPRK